VHRESEAELGEDEGVLGAEVLDLNDDMDEYNEIPFEIPKGTFVFELVQAVPDESVFRKKKNRTPWMMLSWMPRCKL
jgi:hypothetical protein